jgi:hypothetical protein
LRSYNLARENVRRSWLQHPIEHTVVPMKK